MRVMKKGLAIVMSLLLLMTMAGCGKAEPEIKISIVQIADHPALDAARDGFIEALKDNGYEEGKNVAYDIKSAQGDQNILHNITTKFVSDNPDLILAIATPAAQDIASKTSEIPILITAVTDPVGAGLVNSLEKPGTNVTGTTDMNPIQEQFELMKKLIPNVKKVGIIYNAAEQNSTVQVDIAKQVAATLNIEILEATAASSADVLQAAQSLVGKVDAFYIPTDNTVVSAADSVVKVSEENKIPIIAGESSVVDKGGLATIGINYKKLGYQTGEMAVRVLKGENPADMPIEKQKDYDTVVNVDAAKLLGIEIPDDVKKAAGIQ